MGGHEVAAVLRRQHGVISRDQALESGMTEGRIRSRIRTGECVVRFTG